MLKTRVGLTMMLVALFGASIASAGVVLDFDGNNGVTLQDLIDGEAVLQWDDKIFTDWTYSRTPGAPDASAIVITPGYIDVDGNGGKGPDVGLKFQDTWQTASTPIDSLITFIVTVTARDPNVKIDDIEMYMPGAAADNGGSVSIVENVEEVLGYDKETGKPIIGPKVGGTYVYDFGNGVEQLLDHTYFANEGAYRSVKVTKDVGLIGPSSLSVFYQGFSQIPEPATLSVFMLGSLIAVRWRTRR